MGEGHPRRQDQDGGNAIGPRQTLDRCRLLAGVASAGGAATAALYGAGKRHRPFCALVLLSRGCARLAGGALLHGRVLVRRDGCFRGTGLGSRRARLDRRALGLGGAGRTLACGLGRRLIVTEQGEGAAGALGAGHALARHRPLADGATGGERLIGHRHLGADVHSRVEVQHVLIVQPDAALGDGCADGPGGIGAMNAVHARPEVETAHAQRVQGMAARHPPRQAGVLCQHDRSRGPGRVDPLLAHIRDALPAALLARDGNRIADRLPGLGDEIEFAIAETDDDLALGELRAESHHFAAASANRGAASPVERQLLCRCRLPGQRCERHKAACRSGSQPCLATNDHLASSLFWAWCLKPHRRSDWTPPSLNTVAFASQLPCATQVAFAREVATKTRGSRRSDAAWLEFGRSVATLCARRNPHGRSRNLDGRDCSVLCDLSHIAL